MTSSVIYYSTDARKNEIYLLNILVQTIETKFPNCLRPFRFLRNQNTATISESIKRHRYASCDWLDTLHTIKDSIQTYTDTSLSYYAFRPRTVSEHRRRSQKHFSDRSKIFGLLLRNVLGLSSPKII